jgi:hypothetical protein
VPADPVASTPDDVPDSPLAEPASGSALLPAGSGMCGSSMMTLLFFMGLGFKIIGCKP